MRGFSIYLGHGWALSFIDRAANGSTGFFISQRCVDLCTVIIN